MRINNFNPALIKKNIFILLLFVFAAFNSLKIGLIEYYLCFSTFIPTLDYLISFKYLLYILLNLLVLVALTRFTNKFLLILFYLIQSMYLFIHLSYFIYFEHICNMRLLILQFWEGAKIAQNLIIPPSVSYWIILIDLPFFIFILWRFRTIHTFLRRHKKRVGLFIVLLSCLSFFISYSHYHKNRQFKIMVKGITRGELEIIIRGGLLCNDLISIRSRFSENTLIKQFDYGDTITYNSKTADRFHNVICIQVEGLGTNAIDHIYKGKHITPFLHELSSRCVYYPRVQYFYNAGHTSDTEFAVLNSAIALRGFPSFKLRSYLYPNSFIKRLTQEGFEAFAFHNNVGTFFNRNMAFIKIGFDKFYDMNNMGLQEFGWGATDADVLNYMANKLSTQKSPFLYYFITMSSHFYYDWVREYYVDEHFNSMEDSMTKEYFNSFSYVDKVLKDFITYVRTNFKNTYIFIFGDHKPYLPKSEKGLFTISGYIPLFIITPDNQQYRENNRIVSVLDLAPTILYASGINFEIKSYGLNLLDFPVSTQVKNSFELPPLVAHAGGRVEDLDYTNSLEAINTSYDKGFRYIELDLAWTEDKHLVLLHDWDITMKQLFGVEGVRAKHDFKQLKMVNDLTQMTLDDLAEWLKTHRDVHIITDIPEGNVNGLIYIKEKYANIQDQFIPQIYGFDEYDAVKALGYKDIILTLYSEKLYDDNAIINFIRDHPVAAVTIPRWKAIAILPFKLNRLGIPVYAHTIDDKAVMNSLQSNWVYGIYTDNITPES